jgi:uncharacterized protein
MVTMNEGLGQIDTLEKIITEMAELAVAVSGGVDSLTLAAIAHQIIGGHCQLYHAVSPAVPPEATQRTRGLAGQRGWSLHVVDAGEFENNDYLRNPVNRCFFCKTSLYGAIRRYTAAQIVAGTNLDDLGEYRPGLLAAKDYDVRQHAENLIMPSKEAEFIRHTA